MKLIIDGVCILVLTTAIFFDVNLLTSVVMNYLIYPGDDLPLIVRREAAFTIATVFLAPLEIISILAVLVYAYRKFLRRLSFAKAMSVSIFECLAVVSVLILAAYFFGVDPAVFYFGIPIEAKHISILIAIAHLTLMSLPLAALFNIKKCAARDA